jgi:O-antigen/teichoic acid export membrane protein
LQDTDNIKTKINFGSQAFKRYFTNTSWLLAERIVRLGINLFINLYVIRYLGPEEFGLLSYAISFASIFATISTLGLDNLLIRELVKEPDKRDALLGSAFTLKIIGAIISFALIAIALLFSNDSAYTVILILIIAASTLFQSFNVIDFYFQSQVQAKFSVYVQFTSSVVLMLIKLLMIYFNAPLILFAVVFTLESFFWAIGFSAVYKKNHLNIFAWKFNKEIALQLLKDSWPLILSGVVIAVYMKIGQVIVKKLMDDEQVGYYAAAVKLSEAWYFIPMAISTSLFPAIVNAKKVSEELYQDRMQKLYDLLAWTAIAIAVPVTFFSDIIVKILLGAEYLPSAPVLTIYIWAGVSTFLGVASSQYLINENLTKLAFYRTLIGMVVNIILNFALIPAYGIVGSAVATLVSYSLATFSIGISKNTFLQLKMMLKSIFMITAIKHIAGKWKSR